MNRLGNEVLISGQNGLGIISHIKIMNFHSGDIRF